MPTENPPAVRQARRRSPVHPCLLAILLAAAPAARASDSLQAYGFALLRPQLPSSTLPLDDDSLSAQLQVGLDWRPSPAFGAHVHLLGRNQEDGSKRGRFGIVEAFAETNAVRQHDRFRLMLGAFFLPTSRENIDSLWETPYTITSSALNSWMGEEFRPVGADLTYTHRTPRLGAFTAGATVFTGNDTWGALPIDRGWSLTDRWALLGEHIPVNDTRTLFTSVSAETDHRPGWSWRAKWNNDHGALQFTHIDNRSDALRYGELYNWATQFDIAGADYSWRQWTVVAETGWGPTAIIGRRGRRTSDLRATYVLLSRRIARNWRASARFDDYLAGTRIRGRGLTAAVLWDPQPHLRLAAEAIRAQGQKQLAVEARYRF